MACLGSLHTRLTLFVFPIYCCNNHFVIPRYNKCIESKNTDFTGSKFGMLTTVKCLLNGALFGVVL